MGAATAYDDLLDQRCADAAGLALAGVDQVLELEEAGDAVRVDVVGDGGAAELDGAVKHGLKRGVEAAELGAGEAGGLTARADAGASKGLVGVDVADAVEKRLVEQGGLDGGFAAAEESGEVGGGNGERFLAGAEVRAIDARGTDGQASEAAGIDEAELASRLRA